MLLASVKDDYGKVLFTFEIPEKAEDIKYSMYIDYSCYTSEIFNWVKEKQEKGEEYFFEYKTKIAKAVCKIFSTPENIIDYEVVKELKYKKQEWLWQAWALLEKVICDFQPTKNGGEFIHNGKDYKIPAITKSIIFGTIYDEDLTFQQTQEIVEIQRDLAKVVKYIEGGNKVVGKEGFEKVEAIATATYTSTLQTIALCLADPKEIPTNASFMRWLDERCLEIQDLDMVNGLNTIFFLMNISEELGTYIELSHILKALSQPKIKANRQASLVTGKTK